MDAAITTGFWLVGFGITSLSIETAYQPGNILSVLYLGEVIMRSFFCGNHITISKTSFPNSCKIWRWTTKFPYLLYFFASESYDYSLSVQKTGHVNCFSVREGSSSMDSNGHSPHIVKNMPYSALKIIISYYTSLRQIGFDWSNGNTFGDSTLTDLIKLILNLRRLGA